MNTEQCNISVYNEIVGRAMELKHPLDVMWELTYRCNLECKHCYITPGNGIEISTEKGFDLLQQLADAGVLWLTFSGGEPFLRADIFELLERARSLNFAVMLFTNGTLIGQAEAKRLASLKLSGVEVSIYGASPVIHDAFTGIEGSFEKTMAGIKYMLALGVPVTLKTCIVRSNMEDMTKMEELCNNLGVRFRMTSYLAPQNDGDTTKVDKHRLTDYQLEKLYREDGFSDDNDEIVYPDLQMNDQKDIIPCSAGHITCGITPDGRILPCPQFVNGGDSIFENDFLSIWRNSEYLQKIREIRLSDVEICNRCPGLKYCFRCQGIALIEDGDLLGPSSEACRNTRIFMRLIGNEAQVPPA
ncbi:MAG: radical SAM protein [Candidatus Hatepunaea meridiana]|nr:radical SAM protein [Candidatus Hatepunaea meridiana]